MINKLIVVLGRQMCLSPSPNTRKGGLLGLASVMIGFKNGSSVDPPQALLEEVVRPILTCLSDSDPRVRWYACESLINVIKVAKANILNLFDCIFDIMSKIIADPDINVRSGAEMIDRLLKDIFVDQSSFDVQAFAPRLENYLYTKNPFTRMFIISWINLLNSKADSRMIHHLPKLLDGIFTCLYDSTEEIKSSTLNLLSEFLNEIEKCNTDDIDQSIPNYYKTLITIILKHARNDRDEVVQYTAITWLRHFIEFIGDDGIIDILPDILEAILPCLAFQSTPEGSIASKRDRQTAASITRIIAAANITKLIQALCKTFRDNEIVFEERGTFIILNLCSIDKPEIVYKAFAEIIKDEKMDSKFAYHLVQKLNQILLTTQPLYELRSRLGNDDDPEMKALFYSLYYAWCYSPIASLTLCFLTNHYRHACEIVTALSRADINLETLTQIDWTVQLIESPVFASLRMRLLDSNSNQYLLQSLYGLLMILPQSEAYRRLSHRLDQVYKFMSIQPQQKAVTTASQVTHKPTQTVSKDSKQASSPSSTSLDALMKHYYTIQNQTRDTRRP